MKRSEYRLNQKIFEERSNLVHSGKYIYSQSEYKNQRTKVKIICPIHGEFWQTPKNHMNGQGCPECGKKYAIEYHKNNYESFIKESERRFGDIYEFPNIENEYENSHSKITIKCKKCGNEFTKIACDHITSPNGGCKHCYFSKSKPEEEIGEFIKSLIGNDCEISFGDRSLLDGFELDIYIPSIKLAFEFNGLYWHSEKFKNYHLMKTEMCENKGVRLIQIFEDEYMNHKEIVLSKIKHIIGKDYDLEKIYGRKCSIHEIDFTDASDFLGKNHIQGKCKSTVYIGAFNDNKLCGVMLFTRNTPGKWELVRFATDINKRSIGVGGKLFKYFTEKYSPNEIKSFADRRWTMNSENNLYNNLGFKYDSTLRPNYRYFMNGSCIRFHKFGFRKMILNKKYNLPLTMTETEMAEKIGAKKIWDCGLLKYIWKNEEN